MSSNETAHTSSKIQNVDTASADSDEEADTSLAKEVKDVVDSFDEFEKSLVVSPQHLPAGKDAVDEDLSYLEFLKTL